MAADQMGTVTQLSAAMIEETTVAAQTLAGETEQLDSPKERFRTRHGSVAPAQRAMAARHAPSAPAEGTWEDR